MTPPGCRLPLRPPMPTDSFLPRTLRRDDVTVPPGAGLTAPLHQPTAPLPGSPVRMAVPFPLGNSFTAASATGLSLTNWHATSANAQKGAKQ